MTHYANYNADLVELSRRNAQREGVSQLAQFRQGDMYEADFSEATVLALFLTPNNFRQLEPKLAKSFERADEKGDCSLGDSAALGGLLIDVGRGLEGGCRLGGVVRVE